MPQRFKANNASNVTTRSQFVHQYLAICGARPSNPKMPRAPLVPASHLDPFAM